MAIILCPNCGGKVSTTRDNCYHCGHYFKNSKQCPECSENVDINAKECPVCGYVFDDSRELNQNTEVKNTTQENENKENQKHSDGIGDIVIKNNSEELIFNKTQCQYCGSDEYMEIGHNYYMCLLCRNKFFNIDAVSNVNSNAVFQKDVCKLEEEQHNSTNSNQTIVKEKQTSKQNNYNDKNESVNEKHGTRKLVSIVNNVRNVLLILSVLSLLTGIVFITFTYQLCNGFVLSYITSAFNGDITSLLTVIFVISVIILLLIQIYYESFVTDNINKLLIVNILEFLFYSPAIVFGFISIMNIYDYNFGLKICFAILLSSSCLFVILHFVSLLVLKKKEINCLDETKKKSKLIFFILASLLIATPVGLGIKECITNKNDFLFRIEGGYAVLERYVGGEADVVVPSTYKGYYVGYIGSYAFAYQKGISIIELPEGPEGVISIDDYAFYECSDNIIIINSAYDNIIRIKKDEISYVLDLTSNTASLYNCERFKTSITIPSSIDIRGIKYVVTSISSYAFDNCSNLQSIVIPSSITSIELGAFYECRNLEKVYYDGTIEDWCNIAFENVESNPMFYARYLYMKGTNNEYHEVTQIVIPNSITSIGDYAFSGCSSLTSIEIGDNVTSIGRSAFYDCWRLTSIEIGDSVISIGDYAFSGCSNLTSIEIGDNVTSIGRSAFSGCDSLKSIIIPESVTSIGSHAFDNCSSLKIYCEALSKPSGWVSDWNSSYRPVYWREEWE